MNISDLKSHSIVVKFSSWLKGFLNKKEPAADLVIIGTALLVGLGTGVGAVIFRYLIKWVEWVCYTWIPTLTQSWGKTYILIVPSIGGLLVGLLIFYFAREAKGHGVPEVMEAVALKDGRIRPIVALIKSLASSLSIGTGGSVGREGPIVQIGSALGSSVGQALGLSGNRVRNLVACGAAGGIAATFNAPIAGVMFALEIILNQFSVRNFSSVVISAVAASVVGRAVFGNIPAFKIPFEYGINSLWEFFFYPILGVLAAITGVFFTRLLYRSEDFFDSWKRVPEWFRPAIGGLLLGLLALVYPRITGITWDRMPQVFNVGYDIIEQSLDNQFAMTTVLALLILKILATTLTLGSGGSGGVFAPSLFMGAMLGAFFELFLKQLFPNVVAPAGAYALVGMAAVFAASAHAPITAVLILFELTGDYRIILPLMLTVVISTLVGQMLLKGESIYTLKLSRRGVRLQHGRDLDLMQAVTVQDAMTRDVYVVQAKMPVDELSQYFDQTHAHSFPVIDESSNLVGMVSIQDYEKALQGNHRAKNLKVEDIATMDHLIIAYEDESLAKALQRIGIRGINKMPVVTRANPRTVAGVIRRRDIIKAYNLALARRTESKIEEFGIHLRPMGDFHFIEVEILPGSMAANQTIAELIKILSCDLVVVYVRHHATLMIPHGDTILYPGDQLKILVHEEETSTVRNCFMSPSTQ